MPRSSEWSLPLRTVYFQRNLGVERNTSHLINECQGQRGMQNCKERTWEIRAHFSTKFGGIVRTSTYLKRVIKRVHPHALPFIALQSAQIPLPR
jgi:hypothetical protein